MADARTGQVVAWTAAGLLLLLLVFSLTGYGTWMGGVGMGGMMFVPLLLLAVVVYVAYRFGRLEGRLDEQGKRP